MPNQKTSVWRHYNEIAEGRKRVGACKYCGQTYANNATRMKRHLTTCKKCPEPIKSSYRQLLQTREGFTSWKTRRHQGTGTWATDNLRETEDWPHANCKTPKLSDLGEGARPRFSRPAQRDGRSVRSCSRQSASLPNVVDEMSKADQEKADETLARAIFATGVPLSILKNRYWMEHYKLIRPAYTVPSLDYLSHTLLDKEYGRIETMAAQRMSQAESLTLITNGWANRGGNRLVNVVFTTSEPIFSKAIFVKSSRLTGEDIANLLSEEIEKAGLSKVQALVTDYASNMSDAWQILKAKHPHLIIFSSLDHGLALLAKNVASVNMINSLLENCQAIVKAFHQQPVANQTLTRLQKEKQNDERSLLLPTGSGWSSAIKCLESLLHMKESVQATLADNVVSKVLPANICKQILDEDGFWVQVQGVFNLLLPISEAIKKVENVTLTLSNVPEIFRELNENLLAILPSSPLSTKEGEEVKQLFARSFELCCHPVHLAANLLNPQYHGQFLSEAELSTALDAILEMAKNIPHINEVTVVTDLAEYRAKENIWSREIIWQAAENMSPLTWWKGYCNTRQLSQIAVRIFSILPTVERSWKPVRPDKSKKRNQETDERTAKLVSISQNLSRLAENQAQLAKRRKHDQLPTALSQEGTSSLSERNYGSANSELELPQFGQDWTSTSTDSETEGVFGEAVG